MLTGICESNKESWQRYLSFFTELKRGKYLNKINNLLNIISWKYLTTNMEVTRLWQKLQKVINSLTNSLKVDLRSVKS